MNPFGMLKLKPLFEQFCQDHPKILAFFASASGFVDEGSVLELSVKNSEGKIMKTNILVNSNDVALFEEAKKMIAKEKN